MKTLLISHIDDPDGVTPIALASLTLPQFDYILLDVNEVDNILTQFLNDQFLDQYDQIFIIDLGITKEQAIQIENSHLKEKVHLLDHHIGNSWLNTYSFALIEENDEQGNKQCGTTLFYQYLKKHHPQSILQKPTTITIVNHVCSVDNWLWEKENNQEAKALSDLFTIIGKEKYIDTIIEKIQNQEYFYFTEKEQYLLEVEKERIKRYIENHTRDLWIATIENQKIGFVFGGQYKSEVANHIATTYQQQIDASAMMNLAGGISYRTIKQNDVSHIAHLFGGGGHKRAAGSPIPDEIKKQILQSIYGNIKIEHLIQEQNIYERVKRGRICK